MSESTFFSVDRRGFYKTGEALGLFPKDPYGRVLYRVEGVSEVEDLVTHFGLLFPEGLSLHGWEWMASRVDHTTNSFGQSYVLLEKVIELVFEFIRRSNFPSAPSRLTSYFAFETFEQAKAFSTNDRPIYRLSAPSPFRADQTWLRLGVQGIMASYFAHQYWSQAGSAQPKWEILLPPPVKVIEQLT